MFTTLQYIFVKLCFFYKRNELQVQYPISIKFKKKEQLILKN